MFSSLKRTPTSMGRATFLLLILASIISFKCGWFLHSAKAVELPHEEFKKVYQAAKAKALSKPMANAPWFAGEYYTEMEGEGMGHTHNSTHYLTAGYEYFIENVCCMDCGPQSLGKVREIGEGRLELCPSYARVNWYHRECWTVSIVRWGDRQYLVSDSGRQFFEQDIHSGKEPRRGPADGYPMRKGDWLKEARGKPLIPKVNH